jgi:hypothetical protein
MTLTKSRLDNLGIRTGDARTSLRARGPYRRTGALTSSRRRISPESAMFVVRFAIAEGNLVPVEERYSYEHYGYWSRLCGLNHCLGPG